MSGLSLNDLERDDAPPRRLGGRGEAALQAHAQACSMVTHTVLPCQSGRRLARPPFYPHAEARLVG